MAGGHGQEHKRAPDSESRSLCVLPPAPACKGCMRMPPPSRACTIRAQGRQDELVAAALAWRPATITGLRPEMARYQPQQGRQRAT
eukprot:scaffold1574_cov119-Isochrysis_galbana.AAC.7